jgi:diguanylate cyclase (GGDEF)-like protein
MSQADPMSTDLLERLLSTLDLIALISRETDIKILMQKVLEGIRQVMNVEGSTVYEINSNQTVSFSYISGITPMINEIKDLGLRPGQGIVGQVIQIGKPITVSDVNTNPDFCNIGDRITGYKTKQILCVPLKVYNKTVGALQAVNRVDGFDFTKQDLIIFEAFASQVAVALENAKLYEMAVFDGLTRIHNRTFFRAWAETELARALRMTTPLSIALFDIDFFKKFNDTYGHNAGDVVLKTVANLVENNVRKSDVWARWGGEEFILALPDTDGVEALRISDGLRLQIERHHAVYEGNQLNVTVSAGISICDGMAQ